MTTHTNELSDVMNETFTTYKGCLIEKTKTGYKVFGVEYSSLVVAQARIDLAFQNFSNL